MIEPALLTKYNVQIRNLRKGEILFLEGEKANYYHQIIEGSIKMSHFNEEGKEHVLGIFNNGESFGEPPLFAGFSYPASATALTDCSLYRLNKSTFLDLLKTHFDIHLKFTALLSERLKYKTMMMLEIALNEPNHRILTLIDHLKSEAGNPKSYKVELTRQQIADLTGLRVETVIRTIKALVRKGELSMLNHKVYRGDSPR